MPQFKLLEPRAEIRDTLPAYEYVIMSIEDFRSSAVEGQIWSIRREVVRIRNNGLWCLIRLGIEADGAKSTTYIIQCICSHNIEPGKHPRDSDSD